MLSPGASHGSQCPQDNSTNTLPACLTRWPPPVSPPPCPCPVCMCVCVCGGGFLVKASPQNAGFSVRYFKGTVLDGSPGPFSPNPQGELTSPRPSGSEVPAQPHPWGSESVVPPHPGGRQGRGGAPCLLTWPPGLGRGPPPRGLLLGSPPRRLGADKALRPGQASPPRGRMLARDAGALANGKAGRRQLP